MTAHLVPGVVTFALGCAAVLLGNPLATWAFRRVDRPSPGSVPPGVVRAGTVLRGGRVIGFLERAAVFLTILAGWPEGVAVVVAIKGLGRYSELRSATPGAAERFIIGSFTSLLVAAALACLARLVLQR